MAKSTTLNSIEMGATYRDVISGFEGVVTAKCEYMTGCDQVVLKPRGLNEDGTERKGVWFDVEQVERVGDDILVLPNAAVQQREQRGGGPQKDAPTPR